MSAAAAAAAAVPADAAPKKGKKKLILILLAALLVLLLGGGGATVWIMKKKAAEAAAAAEAEDGEAAADDAGKAADDKHEARKTPPVFLPLDPFVVNLADREVDRFAQVGIVLELDDPKSVDQLKLYMPAIRNGILMILAHKTSAELQDRAGKEKLAAEIARAAVRPMGIEIPEEPAAGHEGDGKKKKAKAPPVETPVRAVNFSSFIIQ